MEGSYFPEDKDLAHKIMMDLSNTDLVKLCATNKRMYDICNNYSDFWRNKFIKDYGEHAAEYKPENRSWKTHYMRVFIDLEKFNRNPLQFLDNIAWKNNIENSFFVDTVNRKFIPLKESPEWVINNLYLLSLEDLKVKDRDGGVREYQNITPIELLQKQITSNRSYLNGFELEYGFYYPLYASISAIEYWSFKD